LKRWSSVWTKAGAEGAGAPPAERGGEGGRRFRLSDAQLQTLQYLALLLLAGVVLMSFTSRPREAPVQRPAPAAETAAGGPGPAPDYARALERQLEEALRQLHGVGAVHVSVTLATGPELILAEQRTAERRISQSTGGAPAITDERTSAQPVLVRSDQNRQEQPIVLLERAPVVQGVLVITDAAADSRMRYELTRSVMTLLNLPAHRVYVLPERW